MNLRDLSPPTLGKLLDERTISSRQLVIIASTMRSGSTLLKALLANAPDISNLNEVNFQKFARNRFDASQLWKLDSKRILVLKRPAWYHETRTYPLIPEVEGRKIIVLVRDVYDTVESLRKMTFGLAARAVRPLVDRWLAESYWQRINRRLSELHRANDASSMLVRYEDLAANPMDVTGALFRFLGSVQTEGVDTYTQPNKRWRWGSDDASPKIRSLKVQPPRVNRISNEKLAALIDSHEGIQDLRRQLGYAAGEISE